MRIFVALLFVATIPTLASAQNVGRCGWGSKLFDGQKGIAPQVLAVTTNGTSGNQTFAISSGTSGCTQNGVIKSNWRTAAFVDGNVNRLASDVSRGEGETLASLATLLEVDAAHTAAFNTELQSNFAKIFPSTGVESEQVLAAIHDVLKANAELRAYSARV